MLQPQFTVTPAAEKFMRRMVRFSEHPAGGFRLTVSPGGCSGYNSEFTIEPAPQANDSEVGVNGLRLFLTAESRLMLDGVIVDFADTPTKSGLTFTNPNAAACGCASSGDAAMPAPPPETGVAVDSIRRMAKA